MCEGAKDDIEVAYQAIKRCPDALFHASHRLRTDWDFVLSLIKENSETMYFAHDDLKNNRNFMYEATRVDYRVLFYAKYLIHNDRSFVLKAVQLHEEAITNVGQNFRRDAEIQQAFYINRKRLVAWKLDKKLGPDLCEKIFAML